MSDYSNAYQVACVPGPKSAAAVTRGPGGSPVLVIYLDPVNMSIHSAPSRELAEFFRELAREAAKFAAEIDPGPATAADGPRHQRHGGDVR
jgi:hypothetical protein